MGVALFLVGVGLALVPGPSVEGVPTYPYFTGRGWSIAVECLVVISAALFAISLSVISRYGLYLNLGFGVGAAFIGGFIFVFTLFFDTISVPMGDGMIAQVQRYPQSTLLIVWGIIMLLFLPVSYLTRRRAGDRSQGRNVGEQPNPEVQVRFSR